MTDVEMKDSGATSSKGKAVAKGSDAADGKKKFEVKKVLETHIEKRTSS